MADALDNLKVVLLMMLFYSFAITCLTYSLPAPAQVYVNTFADLDQTANLDNISSSVQDSLDRQTSLPLVDLGALVFYSGNIIIDLLLNFAFAVPQVLGLILTGFLLIFNIDTQLSNLLQVFASVTIMILYFVGLIQLLTNIRSGRVV